MMLKFREHITEALDKPYNLNVISNMSNEYKAYAVTSSGSRIMIVINVVVYADKPEWEIHFSLDGENNATGKGDEFRIFATVKAAVVQWWSIMSANIQKKTAAWPGSIDLVVDKNDPTGSRGRAALYARFGRQMADAISKGKSGITYKSMVKDAGDRVIVRVYLPQLKLGLR